MRFGKCIVIKLSKVQGVVFLRNKLETRTDWKQMQRKSHEEIILQNEALFLFSLVVRSGEGDKTPKV